MKQTTNDEEYMDGYNYIICEQLKSDKFYPVEKFENFPSRLFTSTIICLPSPNYLPPGLKADGYEN